MNLSRLNILLAALLVACAFFVWSLEPDPTVPNRQFIPEMHYSVPFDPQSANALFADGKTLRSPVAGTIPRGFEPFRYAPTEAGARLAGSDLRNPVAPDSQQSLDHAAVLYVRFCQPCHGAAGDGDGVVTFHGFPPPPSFATPALRAMKDGQMFHTITFGKGNMPSLASQMRRDERWTVLLRVRALQQTASQELRP